MLSGTADDLKVLALRDLPADTVWGPFSGSVQSEEPTEVKDRPVPRFMHHHVFVRISYFIKGTVRPKMKGLSPFNPSCHSKPV